MTLLKFDNVTKHYGKHLALDNLTFDLSAGHIVGLLSPNGSGKTTLIKLINGLLQPDSGQVLIKGEKPSAITKAVVSYLPDPTYFNEEMTVQATINYFADFFKDFDHEQSLALMADLAIDTKLPLRKLSKGNKEKVQLILVMSRKAQLYILDEPIGGVDPAARDYILQTIIGNYSPTATVLIATHLIADVEPILDQVLFINQGKIVRQGDVDDLRQSSGLSIDQLFRQDFKS